MTIYIEFTEDTGKLVVDGKTVLIINRDDDPCIVATEVAQEMTKLISGAVFVED